MQQKFSETVALITSRYNKPVQGLVILGSGLGVFADTLKNKCVIPYSDIPHFPQSTVEGHGGNLVLGETEEGMSIACMQGRFHYYEGYDMADITYPVRVLKQLGARFLIVTNAAGGVNASFRPGTLMLITDHINLMGRNPLIGKHHEEYGPRFVDMSTAYSKDLQDLAHDAAEANHIDLEYGIYAAVSGPSYETPAEIRMLKTLGADAVGMSTVPEVIVANQSGMQVLGISCITNFAAGISSAPLNHEEVMETANRVKSEFINLLAGSLKLIAKHGNFSTQQTSTSTV